MESMELISTKVSRFAERVVQVTLVGMVAIMTVIIILQVFMRYLFLYSLSWSEEVARYLMIWVSFLGASLALKYGFHIGVEFVINRIPEKMRGWVNLIAKMGILIFLIYFTIGGFRVSWAVRDQDSPALLFSMAYAYLSAPVGGFFMIIQLLNLLVEDLIKIRERRWSFSS
ncbi:MAG: Tripartite ATP-independent periplasmic transporter DctQ component [Deltaproteobacteria bacterium]|nr:Tripartite ATP-independent periplasmic transporter DctQ component [Deltaproteobacteria bacterium]